MMWKLVLWLNIVWFSVKASPVPEPYYEYLYTRRDGIAYLEPISVPVYRSDANNKTFYIKKDNPKLLNSSSTLSELQSLRTWNDVPKSNSRNNNIQAFLSQQTGDIDKQLEMLQTLVIPEEVEQCSDGPTKFVDCNYCVCMGGQLYVCTSRKCADHESHKLTAFHKHTNCIEGEFIRSYDHCNRCYCGGGEIICTRKKCNFDNQDRLPQRECSPGERIPSPDGCNSCACNTRSMIVCTTHTCGPEIATNIKGQVCIPNTWYSMAGDPKCRDCYCINGKLSFCYMNLCRSINNVPKRHVMMKLSLPGALPDHCIKSDYMQDKCTKCFCTHDGLWACKTRNLNGDCTDHTPERWKRPQDKNRGNTKHNEHPGNNGYDHGNHDDWNRPKKPISTGNQGGRPGGNGWDEGRPGGNHGGGGRPNGNGWDEGRPNGNPGDGGRPYGNHGEEGRPNGNPGDGGRPYSNHGEEGRPNSNSYQGEEERPNSNNWDEEGPNGNHWEGGEEQSETKPKHPIQNPDSEEGKWPGQLEPPDGSGEEDFGDTSKNNNHEGFKVPGDYAEDARLVSADPNGGTTQPHDGFGPEQGFDTNVDTGPVCSVGEYFSQGSSTNCQGCFCAVSNEWKCWNVKGPCRGFLSETCNPGKIKKNSMTPCSVCYCGADKTSYCATDEMCSYTLEPTKCEALTCLQHCGDSNANFGLCHDDKCICVQ